MSTIGIELRHMRYFAAVADLGKVSLAANRLYLTQPGLSQALRQLEAIVGVELLRRHPRGVELTAAGQDFLVEARTAVAAADRAIAAATRHARGHNEELVVGFLMECYEFLAEPLQRFAAARPDLHLRVRQLDFITQDTELREGRVDIVLLGPPPPDAHTHLLRSEPMLMSLPRSHPLATQEMLTIDALGDELFARMPSAAPGYFADHYYLTDALGGRPRLTEAPFAAAGEVVIAIGNGELVAAAPAFLAARYLRDDLVNLPLIDGPRVAIGFAWYRETPTIEAFVESLMCSAP